VVYSDVLWRVAGVWLGRAQAPSLAGSIAARCSCPRVYAELAAADAPAAQRYLGIAAHLAACGPCGEDFDGLLAAIRGTAG